MKKQLLLCLLVLSLNINAMESENNSILVHKINQIRLKHTALSAKWIFFRDNESEKLPKKIQLKVRTCNINLQQNNTLNFEEELVKFSIETNPNQQEKTVNAIKKIISHKYNKKEWQQCTKSTEEILFFSHPLLKKALLLIEKQKKIIQELMQSPEKKILWPENIWGKTHYQAMKLDNSKK